MIFRESTTEKTNQNGTQNHVCKIDISRSVYKKKKLYHLSGSMAWKSIPLSGLAEIVLTFLQRLPIP
jgi:hypothetical protein